jgi:hypothetical protein
MEEKTERTENRGESVSNSGKKERTQRSGPAAITNTLL